METETKLGDFFELPNPSLRSIFARTNAGYPDDVRPPFWKGKSRAEVLSAWDKIFDSLGAVRAHPGLVEYEKEMRSKVGPMSIQQPLDRRINSIESYYTLVKRPGVPVCPLAIDLAIEEFKPIRGVRERTPRNTVSSMRLNTFSGSPYGHKRRNVVTKTLAGLNVDGSVEGYDVAAVLLWRGQEGGPKPTDVKQRDVWGFPFGVNIRESQFTQPCIEAIQHHDLIPAYVSMESVDSSITKCFDSKKPQDLVVCTDFTKFDQHFNEYMQAAGREFYANLFAESGRNVWLEEIFPLAFTIPLVANEVHTFVGDHGMGSGSGQTNLTESLAHRSLQFEAARKAHSELNRFSGNLGDDGYVTYPGITVKQVTQAYTSHGLEMNLAKQYASAQDCQYLRRWHGVDYRPDGTTMVGVYSTYRALGRLLAQERYYDPDLWSATMVELRAWSILENCKWHPGFEEFVDFVIKGDKFRLGLDIPGFMDNVAGIAQRAISELPDLLGYTKQLQTTRADGGITSWRICDVMRSKAKR